MGLSNFLFGKKEQMMTPSLMTGGQSDLLQQLMGGLSGQGGIGGGPLGAGMQSLMDILGGGTEKFEQPLMRQFYESEVPKLAEMFGGADALGSSGFQQSLGQAGAGLAERLGAMRGGLQNQAMGQLGSMMGQGLGAKQFQPMLRPETFGLMGQLGQGLGQGIGSFGSMMGMGKLGSMMGLFGKGG